MLPDLRPDAETGSNIVTRNFLRLAKDRGIIRSALWNRKPSM